MNYYIYRTIGIFLTISLTLILGVLTIQYYYIDHAIIKKEQSELDSINLFFSNSSNKIIREEFRLVDFLSKTNYFIEALKVKKTKDLFKFLNRTKNNKQDDLILFIVDKEQNIKGSLFARTLLTRISKKNISKLKYETIIPLNDIIIYLVPYENQRGEIMGYLGGILPMLTIKNIIKYKYDQLVKGLTRLSPRLLSININKSKAFFNNNDQPLRMTTITSVNYNNIFKVSKRFLITVLCLIVIALLATSLLLRKTIKEPMINILSLVDSIGKGKINYNFYKKIKDKDYLLIGDALLEMNRSQVKLEMGTAQLTAYRERLDILEYFKHNLQSPLITIENILINLKNKLSEKDHNLLELAFERIEDITSRPIDPNLIESSRNSLSLNRVVLNIITQKKIEFVAQSKFKIEYDSNVEKGNDFVSIDSSDLREVISNLINNSVDAIDKEGKILLIVNKENDSICLTIKDNGIGILKENLEKVFNKNYSTKRGELRGIGLYHAQNTLRNYDVGLDIESQPGRGTEVKLIFPVVNISKSKYRSIVLIDDDDLVRTSWIFRAQKSNMNLVTFSSYKQFKEGYHGTGEESLLFIDSYLKFDSDRGEYISKEINDNYLFHKIFLVTGKESLSLDEYPWITKYLCKRFPEDMVKQYS